MGTALANERKSVARIVHTFLAGGTAREGRRPDYQSGPRYFTDGTVIEQWGHVVARKVEGGIRISDAGYRTVTTKQMLNAVLDAVGSPWRIGQEKYEWHFYNWQNNERRPWNGSALIKTGEGAEVEWNRARKNGAWYYGHKKSGGVEKFWSRAKPTVKSHGGKYVAVTGPFKTPVAMDTLYGFWWHAGPHTIRHRGRVTAARNGKELILQSSSWIFAPGFVKWVQHGYATSKGKNRELFASMIGKTWTGVSPALSRWIAARKYPISVRGDSVVVEAPSSSGNCKKNGFSAVGADGVRYTVKKIAETGEWAVVATVRGKRHEGKTYYASDKEDAIQTWKKLTAGRVVGHVEIGGPGIISFDIPGQSLPNGIRRVIGNLHTKEEQERAKKLVYRYYSIARDAILYRRRDRAAMAYGALAAIRRIASMERPPASGVAYHASEYMKWLRAAAKGEVPGFESRKRRR